MRIFRALRFASSFFALSLLDCPASDGEARLTVLLEALRSSYEDLGSFESSCKLRGRYDEDFLSFMESRGTPFPVYDSKFTGEYKFFSKGEKFCWDVVSHWGNMEISSDAMGAWNGKIWHTVDRTLEMGPVMDVQSNRGHHREGLGFAAFPFDAFFHFLMPIPEDESLEMAEAAKQLPSLRVGFDDLADRDLWSRALKNLDAATIVSDADGQYLNWEFTQGRMRMLRSVEIKWRVVFDLDHPTFPKSVEAFSVETGKPLFSYAVTGPFGKVGPLDVPTAYTETNFDPDGVYPGIVSVSEFYNFVTSVNPKIVDEKFNIDARKAVLIRDLDTGNNIRVREEKE